jgi:integrase/recombinase XerD
LYQAALRVSELCRLRVSDIEINARQIVIQMSKNRTGPIAVPLYGTALKLTADYIKSTKKRPGDYLLCNRGGASLNRRTVFRIVNTLSRSAGIRKQVGTHTFRRSRATHLLNKGMDVAKVSRLLRHRNLATTMCYLNITSESLRREMEEMDEVVEKVEYSVRKRGGTC